MRKPASKYADVVASWSGGIDSTGVAANLLASGYRVRLVTLNIYGGDFGNREREARMRLLPVLERAAKIGHGTLVSNDEYDAPWIWAFSPDGVEIPRRNKHIIDYLITSHAMPQGIKNIGMGEYIGADSWLVRDHVGGADADHRSLAAYIFNEYGLDYRLLSLADFGESRFKVDRLSQLVDVVGGKDAALTSNCLYDFDTHCGTCYKCIERAAAFSLLDVFDRTEYLTDPRQQTSFKKYLAQMVGGDAESSWEEVSVEAKMPKPAEVAT